MKLLRNLGLSLAAIAVASPAGASNTASAPAQPTGAIAVQLPQLQSDKGGVMVNIYNRDDGFPDKPAKALARLYVTPANHSARAEFTDLPYGIYAIAVCHDENANQDCDSNFLGIPKEGVGVSNNAKGFMGPPKFKDAKFELNSPKQEISIKLDY